MADFDETQTEAIIRKFSEHMLERMRSHADRGGWSNRPMSEFQRKFLEKHLQISVAIENGDWASVGKHCVDAANHYMMLANRVGFVT